MRGDPVPILVIVEGDDQQQFLRGSSIDSHIVNTRLYSFVIRYAAWTSNLSVVMADGLRTLIALVSRAPDLAEFRHSKALLTFASGIVTLYDGVCMNGLSPAKVDHLAAEVRVNLIQGFSLIQLQSSFWVQIWCSGGNWRFTDALPRIRCPNLYDEHHVN